MGEVTPGVSIVSEDESVRAYFGDSPRLILHIRVIFSNGGPLPFSEIGAPESVSGARTQEINGLGTIASSTVNALYLPSTASPLHTNTRTDLRRPWRTEKDT